MRAFIFLIFFTVFAPAFTKSADYDVEYGWFKELGEAKATLETMGQNYKIRIEAKTKGLAKLLSGGREEVYESYGSVTAKGYLPKKFIQYKRFFDKAERTTYTFDHAAKKVLKQKEKYEDDKLIDKNEEANKYYADNDILSLYFNIADDFREMKAGTQKIYYAVGANPKDGRVDLIIPNKERLLEVKKDLAVTQNANFVVVFINQKIFSSERGELWIAFNDKNDCEKASLKEVILFGDIKGVLKK